MTRRGDSIGSLAETWVLPLYLSCVLLVGGASREGILLNGLTQVMGAAILVWCTLDRRMPAPSRAARWLQFGAGLLLGYGLLQLLPLPSSIWQWLGARDFIQQGFAAAGVSRWPSMPISIVSQNTLDGLLRFLPPISIFVLTYKIRNPKTIQRSVRMILVVGAISALLGWLQIFGGPNSPFYFWKITNNGAPVGLMANINHQAILLICTIPFYFAQLSTLKPSARYDGTKVDQLAMLSVGLTLSVVGTIISGSVAGYILLGPVAALGVLMLLGRRPSLRESVVGILLAVLVAMIGWRLSFSPILPALGVTNLSDTGFGRLSIWKISVRPLIDFFPFGAGLGTYEDMIPLYESGDTVTGTFINHAHNDYLEILIECGAIGLVAICIALATLMSASYSAWKRGFENRNFILPAATIAVCALLLHSLVDYPLRTETLAAIAAFSSGLMVSKVQLHLRRSNKRRSRSIPNDDVMPEPALT